MDKHTEEQNLFS